MPNQMVDCASRFLWILQLVCVDVEEGEDAFVLCEAQPLCFAVDSKAEEARCIAALVFFENVLRDFSGRMTRDFVFAQGDDLMKPACFMRDEHQL